MTPPLNLSASSVVTFLRCGHQWYLAYVEGRRAKPSLAQARGIAVHKAVEANMLQKVTSYKDESYDYMADAFSQSWEEEGEDGFAPDDSKQPGEVKDEGYKLVELHHDEVSPLIQPMWVERPVQFDLNGITYSGQIDIVDEMFRVRDTKTTGSRPRPESYLFGMTGYAIAARQANDGTVETDVVLDYLVSTKKPYYLPINAGGPVSNDQILRFANTVESVADAIRAGRFVPNGLTGRGVCDWCGYKEMCGYVMKGK
jgi:CRISPR/Cas system-associated exonuclease Cas4 (RecB family)